MEANISQEHQEQGPQPSLAVVVPSKKVQINSMDSPIAEELVEKAKEAHSIISIKIQGNSYSLDFCEAFGSVLQKAKNLKYLNVNDIFVGRLKDEIPKSIEFIATGLVGSNLLRLDISNNAVNPFGAASLLLYLQQAASLQVLLIYNCGLGPLGVAKIAEGMRGTPQLRALSIGRNRMENAGILSIAAELKHVPLLQQLFVYQNTLKEEGLKELFKELRCNCKNITSLDICDNFVRGAATKELVVLIKEGLSLRNLNLSDCLNQEQNQQVVTAFSESENRKWERIGYNYAELEEELAFNLLAVMKECPLKRLDIEGNDFGKKLKKAYSEAIKEGVLSRFEEDEDEEEEVLRLFEEMKI